MNGFARISIMPDCFQRRRVKIAQNRPWLAQAQGDEMPALLGLDAPNVAGQKICQVDLAVGTDGDAR